MRKNIFQRKIYVRYIVSWVRSSHDLCARAHVHSREGTLLTFFEFASLSQHACVMHCIWLSMSQKISYYIAALVLHCILVCASSYLCDLCHPLSDVAVSRVLHSAMRCELLVLRARVAIIFRCPPGMTSHMGWKSSTHLSSLFSSVVAELVVLLSRFAKECFRIND